MQKIKNTLDKLLILFKLFFIPTILCLISYLEIHNKTPINAESDIEFFYWLNWTPWSNLCFRNCSNKVGKQYRERDCVYCKQSECFVVDNKHCSGDFKQFQHCYKGDYCEGNGVYTGVWNEWSKLGECDRYANTTELYLRKCLPSTRTRKLHQTEYSCYDLLGFGDAKREYCLLKSEDEYCYWSKWSEWNCSERCTKKRKVLASRLANFFIHGLEIIYLMFFILI